MSKYFNKIACGFNIMPLQIALRRQPGLFGKYNQRCNSAESPHRESSDIWIRYNSIESVLNCDKQLDSEHPANKEHKSVWYPAYYQLPDIRAIVFDLMRIVEGEELGTILVVKVPPKKQIYTHTDGGWGAEYYEKYLIPVQCYSGTSVNFPDGTIIPELGATYWFDNSIDHNAINESNEDMVVLIVTIRSDKVKDAK